MSKFIYFEDRNVETGHGWRDVPHLLEADEDQILAFELDEDGEPRRYTRHYARCSYAWITTCESYERTNCPAVDELRTSDIRDIIPTFKGADDMEGHFEFHMSPNRMHAYLQSLGFKRGETLD